MSRPIHKPCVSQQKSTTSCTVYAGIPATALRPQQGPQLSRPSTCAHLPSLTPGHTTRAGLHRPTLQDSVCFSPLPFMSGMAARERCSELSPETSTHREAWQAFWVAFAAQTAAPSPLKAEWKCPEGQTASRTMLCTAQRHYCSTSLLFGQHSSVPIN